MYMYIYINIHAHLGGYTSCLCILALKVKWGSCLLTCVMPFFLESRWFGLCRFCSRCV